MDEIWKQYGDIQLLVKYRKKADELIMDESSSEDDGSSGTNFVL